VIDGNNKKSARIEALTYIADRLEKHAPAKPPHADPKVAELAKTHFGTDISLD
jgi:hypothetical protein